MPNRKRSAPDPDISACPRGLPEKLGSIPPPEAGASIDSDELGARFLDGATEHHTLEPADYDEPVSADWLDPDSGLLLEYELDPEGWERAVTRSLRVGRLGPSVEGKRSRSRRAPVREPEELPAQAPDEVDLTQEFVRDASLFDHESAESGEIESPPLRTEDTRTHGRPRGGHLRAERRRQSG